MGFFDRLREGLTRTKQQIVSRFEDIVSAGRHARAADAADRRRHDRGARGAADLRRRRRCRHRADRRAPCASRARRGESLRELVKDEIRAHLRRRRAGRSPTARQPHGHADRRRQRHRQDDDGRQAGQPAQGLREAAAGLRRRHLPRGRGRAARDLGEPRGCRHRPGQGRVRSGRRRVRRDSVGARPAGAIRSSSTRPAGCTTAST